MNTPNKVTDHGDVSPRRPVRSFIIFIHDMSTEMRTHKTNQFIHEIFSPYGKYKWTNKSNSWVRVDLTDNKKPFSFKLGKNELKSTYKTLYVFANVNNLFTVKKPDTESFEAKIIKSSSFDEQVTLLTENIMLNKSDVDDRSVCIEYLQCLLNFHEIKCQLSPIGSTVTLLGVKHADLDIFIKIQHLTPPVSKSQAMTVLSQMRKILKRELKLFIPPPIPARCPIIKIDFCAKFTDGISIDISVSGDHAVQNSKLLNNLAERIPAFKRLASLIKYWMINCLYIGPNQISSYICLNLVLFFLQCHKCAPSVSEMNRLDGLCERSSPPLSNLLLCFFNFYSKFPFNLRVISTHLGRALAIENLRHRYDWDRSPITIQDAIEVNSNKGINVSETFFEEFRSTLTGINAFIARESRFTSDDELASKLYALLIKERKPGEYFSRFASSPSCQSIRMPKLLLDRLDLMQLTSLTDDMLHRWSLSSLHAVEMIIKQVLRFPCSIINNLASGHRIRRPTNLAMFTLELQMIDIRVIIQRNSTTAWNKYTSASAFINSEKQEVIKIRERDKENVSHQAPARLVFSLMLNTSAYSQVSEIQFEPSDSLLTGQPVQNLKTFISNYLLSFLSLEFAREYSNGLSN